VHLKVADIRFRAGRIVVQVMAPPEVVKAALKQAVLLGHQQVTICGYQLTSVTVNDECNYEEVTAVSRLACGKQALEAETVVEETMVEEAGTQHDPRDAAFETYYTQERKAKKKRKEKRTKNKLDDDGQTKLEQLQGELDLYKEETFRKAERLSKPWRKGRSVGISIEAPPAAMEPSMEVNVEVAAEVAAEVEVEVELPHVEAEVDVEVDVELDVELELELDVEVELELEVPSVEVSGEEEPAAMEEDLLQAFDDADEDGTEMIPRLDLRLRIDTYVPRCERVKVLSDKVRHMDAMIVQRDEYVDILKEWLDMQK